MECSGGTNGGNRRTSILASKTYSLRKLARNTSIGTRGTAGRDPTTGMSPQPLHSKLPLVESACRRLAPLPLITGLRRNELRSLRWSNVDFENGSITVESAYAKNGEVGSVPLHPDLKQALKQLDDERKPAPEDKVFLNRYNDHGSPGARHS